MRVGIALPLLASFAKAAAQNTQLVVKSGGALTVANNYLVLNNTDLHCDGSLNGSAATVWVTGPHNNSFGGAGVPVFGTLVISTSATSLLTLNTDVKASTHVDFPVGLIDLNGHQLTLLGNAFLQGEKETGRVTGPLGGLVTASISGLNHPFQFNLANLGAMITTGAYVDKLTISRTHVQATTPDNPLMKGIQRTYLIQPLHNTGLNATLRFYYLNAELAGENVHTLSLWKSTDGVHWTLQGVDTRNTAGKYVEKSGINSLSYWTLSDLASTSSMAVSSVQITCDNGQALVQWQTSSEIELDHFEVFASPDGDEWHEAGRVPAVNNVTGSSYSYRNLHPQSGNLYRLKIVEQSGATSYSPVFMGNCGDITLPFSVYPNPAGSQSVAQLSVRQGASAVIQVTDITGRPVYRASWNLQPGINHYLLPLGGLAAGSYIVQLLLPDKVLKTQLIKK